MKLAQIFSEEVDSSWEISVRLAKTVGSITGSCPHECYVHWEANGDCLSVCGQEGRGSCEEESGGWAWLCWLEWSMSANDPPLAPLHQGRRGSTRRQILINIK